MTLRHMKLFVSVYQNNGITRASEELHLAQPSVSLAIRELEDYYGIRLFDRISRRLYVTEQGKMFYDYALHIVSLFDEMELGIRNWEHMGTLRIGSSITIGNFLLPGLIKKFTTAHPNMNVKASVHNSSYIEESIVKAVAEGLGISILPYLLVADDIKNGIVLEKEVEGISLSRKFSIIYHKHKYLTPSAREFIQLCHTDEIIQEFDL